MAGDEVVGSQQESRVQSKGTVDSQTAQSQLSQRGSSQVGLEVQPQVQSKVDHTSSQRSNAVTHASSQRSNAGASIAEGDGSQPRASSQVEAMTRMASEHNVYPGKFPTHGGSIMSSLRNVDDAIAKFRIEEVVKSQLQSLDIVRHAKEVMLKNQQMEEEFRILRSECKQLKNLVKPMESKVSTLTRSIDMLTQDNLKLRAEVKKFKDDFKNRPSAAVTKRLFQNSSRMNPGQQLGVPNPGSAMDHKETKQLNSVMDNPAKNLSHNPYYNLGSRGNLGTNAGTHRILSSTGSGKSGYGSGYNGGFGVGRASGLHKKESATTGYVPLYRYTHENRDHFKKEMKDISIPRSKEVHDHAYMLVRDVNYGRQDQKPEGGPLKKFLYGDETKLYGFDAESYTEHLSKAISSPRHPESVSPRGQDSKMHMHDIPPASTISSPRGGREELSAFADPDSAMVSNLKSMSYHALDDVPYGYRASSVPPPTTNILDAQSPANSPRGRSVDISSDFQTGLNNAAKGQRIGGWQSQDLGSTRPRFSVKPTRHKTALFNKEKVGSATSIHEALQHHESENHDGLGVNPTYINHRGGSQVLQLPDRHMDKLPLPVVDGYAGIRAPDRMYASHSGRAHDRPSKTRNEKLDIITGIPRPAGW